VGNLKRETTRETIRDYFAQFGPVLQCTLLKDPISYVSRGFGFVTFTHPKTLDRVLKQHHFLDDKLVPLTDEVETKRAHVDNSQKEDIVEKIIVSGLQPHIDQNVMREYFEGFGTVLDVHIMMDKITGESKGYAFVTFEDATPIKEVLEKQLKTGIRIAGKRVIFLDEVEVKYANSKALVKRAETNFQKPRKRVASAQIEKVIVKIPKYDEHGTPYSKSSTFVVSLPCTFQQRVKDQDELAMKFPLDYPIEDYVDVTPL
jgi:RNA-binding protein Musashi